MTFYVMTPTFDRAWNEGVAAAAAQRNQRSRSRAKDGRTLRAFMSANTREKDLTLFVDIAREKGQSFGTPQAVDYRVLIRPSCFRNPPCFEIGF